MSDWLGLSENSKSGLARSEVFTNTSCHGKRRFSSDNIYTQLVQKFGTMGGEIEVLWLHSNFGNRSKERTGLDRIGPDGELAIGPRLGVRVAIGWTVVCEEKNLLASKRSSLLPLLLDRPAGPFSSGLNIRTLLALSNSSRLIESPPSSSGQEWERPFGMGGTDKPLLAVSIASKLLLQQHDDSAIPGTMRTTSQLRPRA